MIITRQIEPERMTEGVLQAISLTKTHQEKLFNQHIKTFTVQNDDCQTNDSQSHRSTKLKFGVVPKPNELTDEKVS